MWNQTGNEHRLNCTCKLLEETSGFCVSLACKMIIIILENSREKQTHGISWQDIAFLTYTDTVLLFFLVYRLRKRVLGLWKSSQSKWGWSSTAAATPSPFSLVISGPKFTLYIATGLDFSVFFVLYLHCEISQAFLFLICSSSAVIVWFCVTSLWKQPCTSSAPERKKAKKASQWLFSELLTSVRISTSSSHRTSADPSQSILTVWTFSLPLPLANAHAPWCFNSLILNERPIAMKTRSLIWFSFLQIQQ